MRAEDDQLDDRDEEKTLRGNPLPKTADVFIGAKWSESPSLYESSFPVELLMVFAVCADDSTFPGR